MRDSKTTKCVGYHTGDWQTEKEATCTEKGLKTTYCYACKKDVIEETEMLPHDLGDWLHTSTDHYKVCSTCNQAFNQASHDSKSFCTVCGSPFELTLNSDRTGYILSYPKTDISTVTIPESFDGKPVTALDTYAFRGCSSLTSITIPESIESISFGAFAGCTSLTSITIPESVTTIGGNIFGGCSSLTSISVAKGNKTYHSDNNCIIKTESKTLIAGCKTSRIPDDGSVTKIADYTFNGCSALTDLTLSRHITEIAVEAFANCTSLKNIYFSGDLADWCGISGLVNFKDCLVHIDGQVLQEMTDLTIPDGVTTVSSYAFYDCKNLTSLTIADSVTKIGYLAFGGCTSVKTMTLPANLIPDSHKSAEEVIITSGETIVEKAFNDYNKLTHVTIPDSVTSIGDFAFRDCKSLKRIEIPDSVTEIGGGVFYGCSNLETVKLSNKITALKQSYEYNFNRTQNYSFFENCTSLKSIVIPDSVTYIDYNTFANCTSLKSVVIPDSVTSIGHSAFINCTALESIEIPDSVTDVEGAIFYGCSNLKTVKLGNQIEILPSYSAAGDNYVIDSYGFFEKCSSLISVTIPDKVTEIRKNTFKSCTNLQSVILGKALTSIDKQAFIDCTSLTEITYTGDIAGWCSFDGLENLTSITFYLGDTKLQEITSVTIPDGVTGIAPYAFYGCTNLTSVTIPDSVTVVGYFAFKGCASIKTATVPACALSDLSGNDFEEVKITSGENIPNNMFENCTSLKSIQLPDGLKSIGHYAFKNCTSLESINIPDSVISIGGYAFLDCDQLTEKEEGILYVDNWAVSLYYETGISFANRLRDGTRGIADYLFKNISYWVHSIPSSVTAIGNNVFECVFGEKLTRLGFQGTMEQWNAIYKGDKWDYGTGNYTIYCTDGNITKN